MTKRREALDDRQQQLLLGARAMRLRLDDDLMFRIDGGDAGVALDDALRGRHLRALTVRLIVLTQSAGRTTAPATRVKRISPRTRRWTCRR